MEIKLAETDTEIRDCFVVMRELRPLADADGFLERVREQQSGGYRLACLREDGEPLAVAGFRLGYNLAWGRHLYVDDLVTLERARSHGHGARLLAWLADHARAVGARELHLDSGNWRRDAHRFYREQGLEQTSLHFRRVL